MRNLRYRDLYSSTDARPGPKRLRPEAIFTNPHTWIPQSLSGCEDCILEMSIAATATSASSHSTAMRPLLQDTCLQCADFMRSICSQPKLIYDLSIQNPNHGTESCSTADSLKPCGTCTFTSPRTTPSIRAQLALWPALDRSIRSAGPEYGPFQNTTLQVPTLWSGFEVEWRFRIFLGPKANDLAPEIILNHWSEDD